MYNVSFMYFIVVYIMGILFFLCFFFFFKQKTAYEMRISDWSSDVCSSDLGRPGRLSGARRQGGVRGEIWSARRRTLIAAEAQGLAGNQRATAAIWRAK